MRKRQITFLSIFFFSLSAFLVVPQSYAVQAFALEDDNKICRCNGVLKGNAEIVRDNQWGIEEFGHRNEPCISICARAGRDVLRMLINDFKKSLYMEIQDGSEDSKLTVITNSETTDEDIDDIDLDDDQTRQDLRPSSKF